MRLDATTLLFAFVLLQLLEAAMITALWMANRRVPGLGWWAAGIVVQVVGFGLAFLQETDVPRFFSFFLLNLATWSSATALYVGVCRFRDSPVRWRLAAALFCIAGILYSWFLWGSDLLWGRVEVTAVVLGIAYAASSAVMWGEMRPPIIITAKTLSVGLIAAALTMFARVLLWSIFPDVPWAKGDSPVASYLIVAGLVLMFTWVFFVVMLVTCFRNHELLLHVAEETRSEQALNAALVEVESQKSARLREHLSRDLHDGIGTITANLAMLASLGMGESDAEKEKILREIESMALLGNQEIRGLLSELDKGEMAWQEFLLELRRCVVPFNEAAGIATRWDVSGEIPDMPLLEGAAAASLAKILREAVHNIVRHSGARESKLEFLFQPDYLLILVSDDGIGFSEKRKGGRGLANMERRCKELGGKFSIQGGAVGTKISIGFDLPISPISEISKGAA